MRCCRDNPSSVRFALSPDTSLASAETSLSERNGWAWRESAARRTIASLRTIQSGSPMQSGAEGGEADEHPGLDAARGELFVEENRQRAGGGVAVPLDVVRHFLRGQSELFRHGLDDAQVGLMTEQQVDVRRLHAGRVTHRPHRLRHLRYSLLEHLAPFHHRDEVAAVDLLVR